MKTELIQFISDLIFGVVAFLVFLRLVVFVTVAYVGC